MAVSKPPPRHGPMIAATTGLEEAETLPRKSWQPLESAWKKNRKYSEFCFSLKKNHSIQNLSFSCCLTFLNHVNVCSSNETSKFPRNQNDCIN